MQWVCVCVYTNVLCYWPLLSKLLSVINREILTVFIVVCKIYAHCMIVYKAIYINGLGVLSSSFYFIVLWCVSSGFAFIVYFDTFILHIFGNTNVLCVFVQVYCMFTVVQEWCDALCYYVNAVTTCINFLSICFCLQMF